jgi:hypothetical protein
MRDFRSWFAMVWREDKRAVVLNDFSVVGANHPLFVADLALRGNVFDASDPPTDPVALGVYLGRRQLALETIQLCGKTPEQLRSYMSAPSQETKR